MVPVLVLLVGLPGTGKLTVARALVRALELRGREVRLVDNHHIADPVLELVAQDGVTPLPPAIWERVAEVREAVLTTVQELSPVTWSFVFTADLQDADVDRAFVKRLADIAERRGMRLQIVRLLRDLDELRRRITTPSRRERSKSVSEADAVERAAAGVPALSEWSPLTVDVTALDPQAAAARIEDHLA